jgi:tetratricopeptide (TPR) repeat protein
MNDRQKSDAILDKCLLVNSKHPRAHYVRAIALKGDGDIIGAIKYYETAIANYPPSDHFHLNEVYNNLGSAFYGIGDIDKAKASWEIALLHLPSDNMVRKNLEEFIYKRPIG